ncbi:MAG TPA: hypothetical protein VN962_10965, partial [Polyangia bacterium]|nr:hypothetical protein [Polyangia bacterium]
MVGACGGGTGRNQDPTGAGGVTGTGGTGALATGGTGAVGTGGIVGTGGTGAVGAPGAFGLIAPVGGSSAQPLTPQLSWQPAAGATAYAVEIATSADFGNDDVYSQVVDGATTRLTVPAATLVPGVVYFWRVSAENGNDYTVATGSPQWFSSPYVVAGAHGLAVTPDGREVIVASDVNDGPIDVIDLTTHIVGAIQTGQHSSPVGVAIAPDGKHALATLVADPPSGVNGVAVIDLQQNTFVDWIDDPCADTALTDVAYLPTGAAAMPDMGPDCATMGLSAFTPDPNYPVFTFTNLHDTHGPFDLAIDPTGAFALVTMEQDNKLYRIDFGVSVTDYTLSAPSAGVAIAPNGRLAVVAEDTLDFVDLTTGDIAPVQLYQDSPGTDIHNVAITPDGKHALATLVADPPSGVNGVAVIDLQQ